MKRILKYHSLRFATSILQNEIFNYDSTHCSTPFNTLTCNHVPKPVLCFVFRFSSNVSGKLRFVLKDLIKGEKIGNQRTCLFTWGWVVITNQQYSDRVNSYPYLKMPRIIDLTSDLCTLKMNLLRRIPAIIGKIMSTLLCFTKCYFHHQN